MKIAVAQLNPTVGALRANARLMQQALVEAQRAGARALVCPELSLVGYPPRDLLERPGFVRDALAQTEALIRQVPSDVTLIFGSLGVTGGGAGSLLTNDAVIARGGRRLGRVSKQLLPTYDVFDEARHFRPGEPSQPLEVAPGVTALVTICEDLWVEASELRGRYATNPLRALGSHGATTVINLSASPFTLAKRRRRAEIFREVATRHRVNVIVANQVGANDELIFDGQSLAWSATGELLACARRFAEDQIVVDLTAAPSSGASGEARPDPIAEWAAGAESEESDAYQALVLGVRDYAAKCGFRSAVVGLSGGIDSALTATLAADALGSENVLGVAMPTRYSSEGSVTDARALAENLGVGFRLVDVDPIFQGYVDGLSELLSEMPPRADDVTLENLQARVRGAALMALSNRTGALVLTTGNKSELAVGYCTLYGDMAGGLAVLSDVPKTMVYRLARHANRDRLRIPQATIDKPPSAELRPDQLDEASLPPYAVLDPILELYVGEQLPPEEIVARGFDAAQVARVVSLVVGAEYKRRQAAPGLILSRKAFGMGRRVPVARAVEATANPSPHPNGAAPSSK